MTTIAHHLRLVRNRIQAACRAAGRDPASVRLLAVSKTFGADAVIEAVAAGQLAFGENYIAEGVEKIKAVRRWQEIEAGRSSKAGSALEWHCIGPIQSNKTKLVAEYFDWVQSVDRLKIAQRLSDQRPADLPPLQICLQVNIDGGANKSGMAPDEVQALAQKIAQLPRLVLRGLMAIPEPAAGFSTACMLHEKTKVLFDQLNASGALPIPMDTLSLGMTADLEAAIHAGSTMVRVGTGLFGTRG
jgi:hypothetical protein